MCGKKMLHSEIEQRLNTLDELWIAGRATRAVIDLVKAEEYYLFKCGWVLEHADKLYSVWKTSEFKLLYSRNFAVMMCKSNDENIGLW